MWQLNNLRLGKSLSSSGSGVTAGNPSLNLNFLGTSTLNPLVTFTRASSGTYFDSTGTLQTAGNNTARFDYNPSTLASRGLLIEEQRTNSIRNNTMQGAVAGTPGTLPTNWSVLANGGLTTAVVGTGTVSGITYIDLRISGTSSTTFYVLAYDSPGAATTTAGQLWTSSQWIALVGGSTANINTIRNQTRQFGGAGPLADENMAPSATFIRKTGSTLTTVTGVTSVTTCLNLDMTSGAAIDITLRIGLPQLEQGAFATSVISTSTAAATRSADVASVNTLSPWYNASAGTVFVEADRIYSGGRLFMFDDGSTNNRWDGRVTLNIPSLNSWTSAVQDITSLGSGSALTDPTGVFKSSFAIALNNAATSTNGATVGTDTSCAVPSGLTRLFLASFQGTATFANGYIRRITYYPRRLSNAALQSLTA